MKDRIVEEVTSDLNKRSELGIKKYNTTLDRGDLSLKQWLNHAYEESLDKSLYLKKSIKEINDIDRYKNLERNVLIWAKEKEILTKGNPTKQHEKTQEETDELACAILDNDMLEIEDALGDIMVTIIIQAKMQGLNLLDCLESAYNVISKRTGKIVNGTFVKDK